MEETATQQNAASGGADPVTAIANAIGKIAGIFGSVEERKARYQEWLANSAPTFKNFFDADKVKEDGTTKTLLIIVALLSIVFLLLFVTVALTRNK